jgi:D-alanyl-lipoteichoic acid acyltransferase DltB (MBOAT superfamily)
MYFHSIDFAIFLPIVFIAYWFIFSSKLRNQNLVIVIASYVFYGWWDYRFLSLLLFSSLVDYLVGIGLTRHEERTKRKLLLITSLTINLGLLGFFKYYNFFVESFVEAFTFFGYKISAGSLDIILPVGISFYTFQTLSYSIDVYLKKLEPAKDLTSFMAFVSFFPQLVAGPIERATNLLPQFYRKRTFDYEKAVDGTRQILWGLFKKVVIADNCAEIANQIFSNSDNLPGSTLFLGGVFFAFQIYGDFSGYSDIAIGLSRLFGFELMKNFDFPYFSRDIAEFWRRWHISLSTWFRDYVYIPLGGSKVSLSLQLRNTFIIFVLSGFWHGARWTFIAWGLLNALYFIPLLITRRNRKNLEVVALGNIFPSAIDVAKIVLTFSMTVVAWIFFRADSLGQAFRYLGGMFSTSFFTLPNLAFTELIVVSLVVLFIVVEWLNRSSNHALENIHLYFSRPVCWFIYIAIIFVLTVYAGKPQEFIYFQF